MNKEEGTLLKKISIAVALLHVFMIGLIGFYEASNPVIKKINQKISVQTITLNPVVKNYMATNKDAEVKYERAKVTETTKPPPKRENKPGPIKQEPIQQHPLKQEPLKKKEPIKKIEDKKKPQPLEKPKVVVAKSDKANAEIEKVKAKKKELLAEAKNSLSRLATTSSKIPVAKNDIAIQKVGKLHVDNMNAADDLSHLSVRELGYHDELISRLKSLLVLPERGDVKIKLTLDHLGKVIKLVIVNFESEKNKKYIEKSVKSLSFPSFQGNFKGAKDHTFSITLK